MRPAGADQRKRTMGSVAGKIARKILSSRGSKVVDLAGWREGMKLAREAGFGDEGPAPAEFRDLDPCFCVYAQALNIAGPMASSISMFREARGYVRVVGAAEEQYLPLGSPMSPLTNSYFMMWALFDVRFGSGRETMGNCVLRILSEFGCPTWLIDTVGLMQKSRMGFYAHCGRDDKGVLLREVGTREIVSCSVPAGYAGSEGEIWFARVLPPPREQCFAHIVPITPYVIRGWPEHAFVEYLERESARMMARKKPPRTNDTREYLMKHGLEPNHWNEYLFCAYEGHQNEAVFLTGIPDIPETLPHA